MKDGFFKWTDEQIDELAGVVLDKGFWWSRRFEYPFCLAQIKPKDVILDAACGAYHPFKLAAGELCKTYACDTEDVPESDRYEFTKANIIALPYEDGSFSKVFCISVLEHLHRLDIEKAIKEFKRVLKPKGKLILTVDYPTCDINRLYEAVRNAGFKIGEANMDMTDAVSSDYYNSTLYCYHIVATA